MSAKPSTPNAGPESIDVNAAFDFEGRQAQADMNTYTDTRPDQLYTKDKVRNPDNGEFVDREDYFNGQRQAHMDDSPAAKPYEELSLVELASKLGEAEYNGDKTIEQDIGDVLLTRLEAEEEKIKDDTYFSEGNPAEALWTGVMSIAEKKKRKLEEQAGVNPAPKEDNATSPAAEMSDDSADESSTPYDWEAQDAFEPFVAEQPEENISTEAPHDSSEEKTEELPVETVEAGAEELPNPEQATTDVKLKVGRAEQARRGEDSILDRRDLRLFGVADGMGGMENGTEASRAAVKAIEEFYEEREEKPSTFQDALQDVVLAMGIARQKVSETEGFTTATFGKIEHIYGKDVLVYGHAGDSRLYYEGDKVGKLVQISDDQVTEDGTTVVNGLTPQWIEEEEVYVPLTEPLITNQDEFGGIELSDGDRLMFCTDGITGDYDPNRPDKIAKALRPEEVQEAFDLASAQEAADRLLKISRKIDDKSVLVIDVSSDDEE